MVRISLAADDEKIVDGIARLADYCNGEHRRN
jgi:hypothetical protein